MASSTNQMLYQEGWGVGKNQTLADVFSGGLSRSYTRTYAPRHISSFHGFSPFLRPALVIAVAEAVPFITSSLDYGVPRLYELKGEIVSQGIRSVTGLDDARLSEAAVSSTGLPPVDRLREQMPYREAEYRRQFPVAVLVKRQRHCLPSWTAGSPSGVRRVTSSIRCGHGLTFSAKSRSGHAKAASSQVSTIFLTNRECPLAMPDVRSVEEHAKRHGSRQAIPAQIEYALARLPSANAT